MVKGIIQTAAHIATFAGALTVGWWMIEPRAQEFVHDTLEDRIGEIERSQERTSHRITTIEMLQGRTNNNMLKLLERFGVEPDRNGDEEEGEE